MISPELCVRCKGYRRLCGLPRCPLLERWRALREVQVKVGLSVYGSTPPSALVGEHGYPQVSLMINIPPGEHGDEASIYDDPHGWWGRLSLFDIIKLRSSMVAAYTRLSVRSVDKVYELALAAVSERPTDVEAVLKRRPSNGLGVDYLVEPTPPSAPALDIRVDENPRVPRQLDNMVNDHDAPAEDALWELYESGISTYTIIRALSMGLLGKRWQRRLVPTRWAITAVDSTLGDRLRNRVSSLSEIPEELLFKVEYLGNIFTILLRPGPYRARWIELWYSSSLFAGSRPVLYQVYEDLKGRVSEMDGGYYAARFSVLEYLNSIGRSAEVVILREVTPQYFAPVGNWHIRESVRRAFERGPVARGPEALEEFKRELTRVGVGSLDSQDFITKYLGASYGQPH